MHRRTVLLVDEDRHVAEELRADLGESSVQVHVAHSQAETVALLARDIAVDLALIDHKLPDAAGARLGSELLSSHGIPFVLLTGHSDHEIVLDAAAAGALAFIVKPASAGEIMPMIEISIARATQMKALEAESTRLASSAESRRLLYLAAGMAMERFGLCEGDAVRLIRSFARRNRLTLEKAAARIVDRSGSLDLLGTLMRLAEKA